ncbi:MULTISPECIES: hypothetical protein [unclassified Streptomyces]|nr:MULTISPECIES: hypothetical protein [unclassified Streptomyces]MCF0086702.1 hypothetical protein [Streptomyces sp. MH192]MCF0098856.1 hypothetical protein [Streptomyces sp. MH191]
MTGIEFRQQHGDPAQWDDSEYEAFLAWATPANATSQPTPTPDSQQTTA